MTTKYYKVIASIQKEIVVSVIADNEETAKIKAIDTIKKQNPNFIATLKEITLEHETEYKVGDKVKHFLFGEGEIVDLKPVTNCNNERGYSATIIFSSGDTKSISLPMPKQKFEILK